MSEFHILDCVIILLKRKKIIVSVILFSAVIASVLILLLPRVYESEARILPPQLDNSFSAAALNQFIGDLYGVGGALLGDKNMTSLYIGLLKSRSVVDGVIDKFDLISLYDVDYIEEARKKLSKKTDISPDIKSGIITITVEDREPQRAYAMANEYIENLKKVANRLALTKASQKRFFYEEQLRNEKSSLAAAEDAMKDFEEESGIIQAEEQARSAIEGIAALKARIAEKEVHLRVLQTFTTSSNPDFRKAREELEGLKSELKKMKEKNRENTDPIIPTENLPGLSMEYLRRLRDLKFHEAFHDLLLKQYIAAKLDEAQEAEIIQVIDEPTVPGKSSGPNKALVFTIVISSGFFLAVFLAYIVELFAAQPVQGNQNHARMDMLRKYLFTWRSR